MPITDTPTSVWQAANSELAKAVRESADLAERSAEHLARTVITAATLGASEEDLGALTGLTSARFQAILYAAGLEIHPADA